MDDDFRDHIATVNEKGKRVWIYPKKQTGKFFRRRQWVSYLLLLFLLVAPHIRFKGEPLILLNVIERKFVLFGSVFWPQDLYIFAIMMVAGVVGVVLFTVIYGRLFCGWVCPQTIFLEFVFRRIDYWIDGDWNEQKWLAKQPMRGLKLRKRILKNAIYWAISFIIANTFLAYIIGADVLFGIQTDPLYKHVGGLTAIVIFTSLFYFVFAYLREQVCTTICPYGRLQGVLLDPNSMVVAYDHVRGEGRAKFKKGEDRQIAGKGDCIDCHQCVNVCPTGIDIRNGTQLECINCTVCIDACDHMMEGVHMEKGLIRIVSENGIKNRTGFQWTRKVVSYTIVLSILVGLLIVLLVTRNDFSTTILRQRGSMYQITEDEKISNTFEIDLSNKTKKDFTITLEPEYPNAEIRVAVPQFILKKEQHLKERFLIVMPYGDLEKGERDFYIIVKGNGNEIDRVKVKFIGPIY
ncbi:MAG: cytochrome c oxidase accessory protein CcoG [Fluviicola sp.]|nr:cytochrome c oxidase accessory protein CcoG [Fluviicola sp.]